MSGTTPTPAPSRAALIAGTVMLVALLGAFVALEITGHSNPALLAAIVPLVASVLVARSNAGLSVTTSRTDRRMASTVMQVHQLTMAVEALQRDVAAIARATNGELTTRIDDAVKAALTSDIGAKNPHADVTSPDQV